MKASRNGHHLLGLAILGMGLGLDMSCAKAVTYAFDATTASLPINVIDGPNNRATVLQATTGTHQVTSPSASNGNTIEVVNQTGFLVVNADTVYGLSVAGSGADVNARTVLVGNNNFGGGATVRNAGTLQVTGTLANSVTVQSGGTLMGTGTVGSIDSGGVLAPGASIGTLSVRGNVTLRSSGTMQVEISPTRADKLAVGGTASLAGTLQVLPETGTYTVGTSYDIITAQAVSGQFNTLATANPERLGNLVVGVVYEGDKVRLVLMDRQVASAQQQTESVKESAPAITRATTQTLITTTTSRIASIINPLRIGVFAPSSGFSRPSSPAPSSAPGGGTGGGSPGGGFGPAGGKDKLGGSFKGLAAGDSSSGWSMWSDASVTLLDDNTPLAKWDGTSKSGMLGFDYALEDDLVAGMVFGIDQSAISLHSVGGEQNTFAGTATLYAGYKFNDYLYGTALAGYGRARNDIRQIVAGTNVKGEYDSNRYFANVSGSVSENMNDWLRLTGTLGYTHMIEAFHPYTSDDGSHVELPVLRLGTMRLTGQADIAITDEIIPYILFGGEKDILNSKGKSNRQGIIIGGGLNARLDEKLTLGFVTNANLGRGDESQIQLGLNVRYRW